MTSTELWSSSIEIKTLQGRGQGVVAVDDIKKGELLIVERAVEVAKGTVDSEKALILNKLLQNIHVRVMKDDQKRKEIFSLFPSKEVNDSEFTRRYDNNRGFFFFFKIVIRKKKNKKKKSQ